MFRRVAAHQAGVPDGRVATVASFDRQVTRPSFVCMIIE